MAAQIIIHTVPHGRVLGVRPFLAATLFLHPSAGMRAYSTALVLLPPASALAVWGLALVADCITAPLVEFCVLVDGAPATVQIVTRAFL